MKRKREGKETETAASTSSSHDDKSGRVYEVFLNFRGPDTRLTIADCLYNDMICRGINAFKDNEELRFGEEIEGGLLQAINESKIYIPIFSKDYASSKWCLRELAHIVELSRDNNEKVILPIFYDVDADDVKLKTKLYRKALRKHKSDSGKDLAKKWKKALREVTRIRGWNLKDYGIRELTNLTVEEVSNKLWTRQREMPDHLVGIKDRMDVVIKKLDLGAADVQSIVIHGMGGVGKTSLAEVVYKQISPQFQGHCYFLKDVRSRDISTLQKELLCGILNCSFPNLSNSVDEADMIKTRFHRMKVLIVLDDIDDIRQIKKLAGKPNWFGGGSRIIITTRNIRDLVTEGDDVPASHDWKFLFYEMLEMDFHNAFQLIRERALGHAKPPPNYKDILVKLTNALGKLPLALDVIGSTLRGKCLRTWEGVLRDLENVMHEDVEKMLMISYQALGPYQQEIFLDIACFFINQEKTIAIKYWDAAFNISTEIQVNILTRMSLIKIINNDKLWMHDLLRDLGRRIVRPDIREIHFKGSRLWSPKDAFPIVQRKMGTENIVALNLGTPEPDEMYIFKRKHFARLVKLRFLELDHGNFEGDFKNIFSNLRWLSWSNCPSEVQATNFGLKNLAVLILTGDNITENWGAWSQIMVAEQLRVLKLKDCPFLRKTPEFSSITRLERLILTGCTRLVEIGESIGNLQHLDYLEIRCDAIESLPESIGGLTSLTKLIVESQRLSTLPHSIVNLVHVKHLILICRQLQKLPKSIGRLESLLELDIRRTSIGELSRSIGDLKRLKILRISNEYLENLPDSIGGLQSLLELDLSHSKIRSLPDCIGGLQSLLELNLSHSKIRSLPNRIGDLKKLKVLNLSRSRISKLPKTIGMLENLEKLDALHLLLEGEIPSEIGALSSLKNLNLSHCRISGLPTTINQLTNLRDLDLGFCESLQQLPELPKSLIELSFSLNSLTTVPDLSNLTNLVYLTMWGTPARELNIPGLERLRALRDLSLSNGKVTLPPTDLSSLSQLVELEISHRNFQSLTGLPSSLQQLHLRDVEAPIDWSLFTNLENLWYLFIGGYLLGEIRFEALGELRKFRSLWMSNCPLLKTLPVLPCLKEIERLSLQNCPELTEIQGFGELKSLRSLRISHCDSLILTKSDLSCRIWYN